MPPVKRTFLSALQPKNAHPPILSTLDGTESKVISEKLLLKSKPSISLTPSGTVTAPPSPLYPHSTPSRISKSSARISGSRLTLQSPFQPSSQSDGSSCSRHTTVPPQPSNAFTPIASTDAGTDISLSDEQPANAEPPITLSPSGRINDASVLQSENALLPIISTPRSSRTLRSSAQPANAFGPILVTPEGTTTAASPDLANAFRFISVTESGIVKSLSAQQPLNANASITPVTGDRTTSSSCAQSPNAPPATLVTPYGRRMLLSRL